MAPPPIRPIPNDPMLPKYTDRCRCMECGEYFNSSGAFSRHRVGDWEDRGANRMCMTPDRMMAKGWRRNATGHWITSKVDASATRRLRRADISKDR